MIAVERPDERTIVYRDDQRNVLASETSGETSTFRSDGQFWIIHRDDKYWMLGWNDQGVDFDFVKSYPLPVWCGPELCWYSWRDNQIQFLGAGGINVSRPSWASYGKLQEQSSGKPLQMLVFYKDGTSPRREVVLFDQTGIKHRWEFDSRIHKGDAKTSRWHELFLGDGWLLCNLSSNGPGSVHGLTDYPHFRLYPDGSGWEPINFGLGQKFHRSHVTVDDIWLAAGHWVGSRPQVTITKNNGQHVTDLHWPSLGNHLSYGHGCLRRLRLIYSLYDSRLQADTQIRLWINMTDVKVADITPSGATHFYSRARPMINPQGTIALWHEIRDGRTVVVARKLQDSPLPPPEENEALKLARSIQGQIEALVGLLEDQE